MLNSEGLINYSNFVQKFESADARECAACLKYIDDSISEISEAKEFFFSDKLIQALSDKEKNADREVKITVNRVLNMLINKENFDIIVEEGLCVKFIYSAFKNISNNQRNSVIYQLLMRKAHLLLDYLSKKANESTSDKTEIIFLLNEIKLSFPIVYSNAYRTFKSSVKDAEVFEMIKDPEDVLLCIKGIDALEKCFKSLPRYNEQFEVIADIYQYVFPDLLERPQLFKVKLYERVSDFLSKFLFMKFYCFKDSEEDPLKFQNFIYIVDDSLVNPETKKAFRVLSQSKKVYEMDYKYDLLKIYSEKLMPVFVAYIEKMYKFSISFEVQIAIYKMLKTLYFIFEDKSKLEKYIPVVLNNLCLFKELTSWESSLESREFGYYLLLNDQNLKGKIKSTTSAPRKDVIIEELALTEHLQINSGYLTQLFIECGSSRSLSFLVEVDESIALLEIEVEESYDIGISIFKEDKSILEIDKIKSDPTTGNPKFLIFVKKAGKYIVKFDNSYSWFTAKKINYGLTVISPMQK